MDRRDLPELHFIAPFENMPSILERGILSHNRARGLPHSSVAAAAIQDRRRDKRVPQGRLLHDFANLYVCGRNPMLFVRKDQFGHLCVLRVDVGVLDVHGVIITDSNAASDYVRFAAAPGGLSIVNQALTFAEDWTDDDKIQYFRKKSAKCAEVLVPDAVAPVFIRGAYVAGPMEQTALSQLCPRLTVTINHHLFFREEPRQ